MADLDEKTLTNAFTQALKNRGIGGSGGGSGFSGSPSPSSKQGTFESSGIGNIAGGIKASLVGLAKQVDNSLDVWRDLSKTGANFSNDLIGLSVSAANSRMSLGDFSKVIKDNNKQFAGLGGSVAKGSQAFADMSKGFFDSKMDLGLRNLAYTTKEMNEVLAIQIGNTRTSTALDEVGRKKSYEAAVLMATEMDMTSKLMGKSREIQMEEMKARQTDAQVQAKIRLEAQKMRAEGKSEAEIAKYKTDIMNSLQKASNEGVGQAAKEIFATGAVTSKTGQMQAGLQGAQVSATADQQKAIRRGDTGAAKEAAERATAEAIKAQNDPTILSLTALGDAAGEYSGVLKESFTSMQTFNDALESVALANKLDLKDKTQAAEAYRLAREKVETADAEDMKKKGAGAVKGALAVERGAQEIAAGAANAATAITKGGKSIADALNSTGKAIADSIGIIEGTNKKKSLGAQIGEAAGASGRPQAQLVRGEKEGKVAFEERQKAAKGGAIGEATEAASVVINKGLDAVNKGLLNVADAVKLGPTGDPVKVQVVDIKAKAGGGFVPGPEINLLGEAGPEWVLNKEQMGKTLEDAARAGVEQASSMMPTIPKGDSGGLNLAEMGKTITKSFSSVSGGAEHTIKAPPQLTQQADRMLGMGKINLKDEQKSVFDEQIKLTGKVAKDKLELIKTEQIAASAANKATAKARDAIEEKYEAEGRLSELSKDKEFKRLGEELNASAKLSEQKRQDLKAALQAEDTKTNAEKIGIKLRLDEVQSSEAEKTKIVETSSEKIKTDITESLPVQAIAKSSADAAAVTQELSDKKVPANTNIAQSAASSSALDDKKLSADANPYAKANITSEIAAGMKAANKTAPAAPSAAAITSVNALINSWNAPKSTDLKAAGATIPAEAKKDAAAKQVTRSGRDAADALKAKEQEKTTASAKPVAPTGAKTESTLNDVVKSLERLNIQMGQLINQNETIGRQQTKAIKSNSANVYDRT